MKETSQGSKESPEVKINKDLSSDIEFLIALSQIKEEGESINTEFKVKAEMVSTGLFEWRVPKEPAKKSKSSDEEEKSPVQLMHEGINEGIYWVYFPTGRVYVPQGGISLIHDNTSSNIHLDLECEYKNEFKLEKFGDWAETERRGILQKTVSYSQNELNEILKTAGYSLTFDAVKGDEV